jgi:sarcosine oxidase subunit gamma
MDAAAESPFGHRLRGHHGKSAAGAIAIRDCSNVGRTGFKGAGTTDWLQTRVDVLPKQPNLAVFPGGGAIIARLGKEEYLILDGCQPAESLAARLDCEWDQGGKQAERPCGFPLPRADSHSWLRLEGRCVPEMMAKICAVDVRASGFSPGFVAQTVVARIGAVLIRDGDAASYALHLLTDSASANYLWDVLEDAGAEFGCGFADIGRQ